MRNIFTKFLVLLFCLGTTLGFSQTTFFNEVDYKTAAPNQCLEIISPTSQDRTGWNVHIYNESGFLIESIDLGLIAPTTQLNDLDIIIVDIVLLTDPKGGMVIEDADNNIIQFLNYGSGTITGQDGPANGLTSENIGEQAVAGLSLQLTGTGTEYNDFVWALPGAATCGVENLLQMLLSPLLPVDLLYFKAHNKNDEVITEWATATEENSFYFYLERSVNGGPFEEIFRTEAAGFSQEELYYSFVDKNPPIGNLYYRLTEVDFDGMMMKSDIAVVENKKDVERAIIFPNPAEDELNIILPEPFEKLQVEIFDLVTGRTMQLEQFSETGYQLQINVNTLEAGQYLVRLRSRGYIFEQRFLKLGSK